MSNLTVTNTDWEILDDLKDALTEATVGQTSVFRAVTVVSARPTFDEQSLTESPVAAVRYRNTAEEQAPEGLRNCVLSAEIIVAAWKNEDGWGQAAKMEEALRLRNLVVNAIETDPPSDAASTGDGDHYHEAITWGEPSIDTRQPWATAVLPVEISYSLANSTSH